MLLWIFLGVVFAYWFYVKFIKILSYWKDRNVPYFGANIIVGSMGKLLMKQETLFDFMINFYTKFKNRRYAGSFQFTKPILVVNDLELIKKICIKDFDHFMDHTSQIDPDVDPIMARNLIGLSGETWKDMRATLSPAFTGSKMKGMFTFIDECSLEFVKYFSKEASTQKTVVEIEMKDTASRFANDVIASVAFGIKCDSLKDRDNQFFKMGQSITNTSPLQMMRLLIINMSKTITKLFQLRMFPEVSNFFESIITKTVRTREEKKIIRPDMIHLLMESRKGRLHYEEEHQEGNEGFAVVEESSIGKIAKHRQKPPISDLDIAAQAVIFFFAGFETVSTVFSFLTYELAINTDVQERLQREIDKAGSELSYEKLLKLQYLDMVVTETLRMWPPAPAMERKCVKSYTIPAASEEESDLVVDAGTSISLPVLGLHRDPKYFPNPDKFDPERFNAENKESLDPYTYMPFGLGPRNCIGSRFALLELKILTFRLLATFKLVPVEKTCIPMVMTKKKFVLAPDNGFWIGLEPRNK